MDPELYKLMMKTAKEVNKKYEQIALEEAKKEGIKEGIKEGERKGKKEGKDEEKIEIAKKLKELLTPEETAEITGLKIEEVRSL